MPSTRTPAPPPAPPRNARFGPYALLDRIAVGGMAEIFRASEPRSAGEPRTVVVKRMLPHIAAHPEARAMFEEEAELGELLGHPNVVDVLGRGQEQGHPYLVLEYIPGVDLWRLGRWLARQQRALGTPLALQIVGDLLAGLHAVHEARGEQGELLGVVHRDVSPSNVLLSVHGDVKLGDFGIAQRRLQESLGEDSRPHRAKGKLGYLSPEQVMGNPVDRRSDVFSAAVIAAELLMGRPLFAGHGELAVLLAIRDADLRTFDEVAPTLPEALVDAIRQALARDPDDRVPDAATFRERLLACQTEPEAPLRRELADLVTAAMGSEIDAPETTPLRDAPFEVRVPSPKRGGPALIEETASSGELAPLEYQVRSRDGVLLGPWTYAQLVEAISTGTVGADDRVSVGGAAFRALPELPELRRHLSATSLTPRVQPPPDARPVEHVELGGGGILTALARSALHGETGVWVCRHGTVRKEVYIEGGVPEFVTSNLAGELLGEYLVMQGVLSRGELDMALAVIPRFDGRLGDTLVALGLVEPVQLFRHIADQVRQKLIDIFLWEAGTADFHRGVPAPSRGFPLGLDPWRILDEGVSRRFAHGFESERWRAGRMLVRAEGEIADFVRSRGPAALERTLQTFEEPRAVEAVGTDHTRPSDAQRRALVLLHIGALRWADGHA